MGTAPRTICRTAVFAFLLLGLAGLARPGLAFDFINGRVTAVTDGDTIRVLSGGRVHKIRFYGVDAPEKDQPFGPNATVFTSNLIANKYVSVKVKERDQYGRVVGEVFHDGISVNRALVKDGLAWWYSRYAKYDYDLRGLERKARSAKKGLWSQESPIAPWDWRNREDGGATPSNEETATDPVPTVFPDKEGEALLAALRATYRISQNLSYDKARLKLFTVVDKNDGSVILVYTGTALAVGDTRPTEAPNGERISTEHTWPKSRFKDATSKNLIHDDLHHLFPVYQDPNASRSNDAFADIDDDVTTKWWGSGDAVTTAPPAAERDRFSESDGSHFEPREAHKGNVARVMMYVYVLYGNDGINKEWFEPQIDVLLIWHGQDPADEREKQRNQRVKQVQGNENPFVLDPTLFERVLAALE